MTNQKRVECDTVWQALKQMYSRLTERHNICLISQWPSFQIKWAWNKLDTHYIFSKHLQKCQGWIFVVLRPMKIACLQINLFK